MEPVVPALTAIISSVFTPWGIAATTVKFVIYSTSLLAVGLLLFRVFLRVDENALAGLRWLSLAAIAVAILATLARVLVQSGRLMDDGIAGMLDPEIIAIVLEGPLGRSTYLRLGGLVILTLAILTPILRTPATLLGAIMVAGSFALTGHATREPQWVLTGLITFHLLAISFWWGALAPLHRLSTERFNSNYAAQIADRFGNQATIIVPLLMMAGGVFAWLLMGSFMALFTTNYGNVLLIKLALVGVVLGFAAFNKLRFVPALAADLPHSKLYFRRSLKLEALAFSLVFAVTAALTTSFTVQT